ncbi:hypothetical protein DW651_08315 [Subdoligranulum sp. AM23-21AC]|nr:hypothetical protein DW651_08315 [Subdoligranulum sp. AM23-21AC]RJW31474.1 hypothetical protein DXC43_07390 [Subdoligranulum sp. TF05-17AC]
MPAVRSHDAAEGAEQGAPHLPSVFYPDQHHPQTPPEGENIGRPAPGIASPCGNLSGQGSYGQRVCGGRLCSGHGAGAALCGSSKAGDSVTKQMYSAAGGGPGNEELARRLQTGDVLAAAQLVSQNEGYLTVLARSCCEPFSQHSLEEDLKQEGAMALLSAAGRFDFDAGTKLLTFATPIVQTAMLDCAAKSFSALPLPPSRYYQLRQTAFLCAVHGQAAEPDLLMKIQDKLNVSGRTARRLLEEYRTVFQTESMGERIFDLGCGGDPAVSYDRHMRRTLLRQRIAEILNPRELTLVRSYLGLCHPEEKGLSFQELAVRLNYNGPSGAEKAYKNAINKLKKQLHGGAYGRWLDVQQAIREAQCRTKAD